MKLFSFYVILVFPLLLLVFFSKNIPPIWFIIGLFSYVVYNIVLGNRKLKRKGYDVGLFAHLNPFSKKSQELYQKIYFEA